MYKAVRNDPHLVDFHKFVYPNEERNQIWQNCYEVKNQPSLVDIFKTVRNDPHPVDLFTLMRKGTKSGRIVMRLKINQVW